MADTGYQTKYMIFKKCLKFLYWKTKKTDIRSVGWRKKHTGYPESECENIQDDQLAVFFWYTLTVVYTRKVIFKKGIRKTRPCLAGHPVFTSSGRTVLCRAWLSAATLSSPCCFSSTAIPANFGGYVRFNELYNLQKQGTFFVFLNLHAIAIFMPKTRW